MSTDRAGDSVETSGEFFCYFFLLLKYENVHNRRELEIGSGISSDALVTQKASVSHLLNSDEAHSTNCACSTDD